MPSSKLLIFSDIHTDWRTLERIVSVEADFYIAAGDLATWGKGSIAAAKFWGRAAKRSGYSPATTNPLPRSPPSATQYGLHNFHERHFAAGAYHIAGLGYSSPTPFDTPGEYTEAQIAERLAPFSDLRPLVLVCHAPPYGTALDEVRPGLHAGSTAVRDFIERNQPVHFFCGHIHEAEGVSIDMGATRAHNVGKKAYLLELE